jgi:hypothetical protein
MTGRPWAGLRSRAVEPEGREPVVLVGVRGPERVVGGLAPVPGLREVDLRGVELTKGVVPELDLALRVVDPRRGVVVDLVTVEKMITLRTNDQMVATSWRRGDNLLRPRSTTVLVQAQRPLRAAGVRRVRSVRRRGGEGQERAGKIAAPAARAAGLRDLNAIRFPFSDNNWTG